MRRLALALAAAAALALTAPSFVSDVSAAQGLKVTQADVRVKVGGPRRSVKKVVVRRDRGYHRGWQGRSGVTKKVIIKKRPGGTVVKKKIIRRG